MNKLKIILKELGKPNINDLSELLDFAELYFNKRKIARITIYNLNKKYIILDILKKYNFEYKIQEKFIDKNLIQNSFEKSIDNNIKNKIKILWIYIGKNKKDVFMAHMFDSDLNHKNKDSNYNHIEFAKLLNYPLCCIENFSNNKTDNMIYNFLKDIVENKRNNLNIDMDILDKNNKYICFSPCNINCKESIKKIEFRKKISSEIFNIKKNNESHYLINLINFSYIKVEKNIKYDKNKYYYLNFK